MNIPAPKNKNYCATVVALNQFVDLPNCDNVKAALIFGNSVIVSKDAQAGDIGLFFPVETQLMREFLVNNNLYRKPEWGNVDPEKKGYFEEHGRIKAVKFRGHKSEGFYIPISSLSYLPGVVDFDVEGDITTVSLSVGAEFDEIDGHVICKKYIPRGFSRVGTGRRNQPKQPRVEDQIIDGQFQFHIDTENLRKNVTSITPDMIISITDKWHGTSAIFADVLVERPLKWWEKLLQKIGVNVQDKQYGLVWSSRRVVKGVDGQEKDGARHFYGTDVWGTVAKEISERVPKGYTVYGEIVGYTPDGGAIQSMGGKPYAYGCQPGQHKLLVYRVTLTNESGVVVELSWPQMKDFCERYGFDMVKELYYGRAGDWGSESLRLLASANLLDWQHEFLKELEYTYIHDGPCPYNEGGIPAEGIVVRIEHTFKCESYKLKSFKFLEGESKQLDKGELDMETAESAAEEESYDLVDVGGSNLV